MTKHRRNKSEIRTELFEQRQALNTSVLNYDAGATWEAKRIASSLYTILFDGRGRTKSLLSQLGIRQKALFLTTSQIGLSEDMPVGLLLINATQHKFVPISCKDGFHEGDGVPPWGKQIPFEDWWCQAVFLAPHERKLTRKNLISAVRSQDGGSHYDEYLRKDAYFELLNYDGNSIKKILLEVAKKGSASVILDALLKVTTLSDARNASIRQIAFEVEFSLNAMDQEGLL